MTDLANRPQTRPGNVALVRISDVMTQGVVTAESGDSIRHVGELMRDHNVGSVVISDGERAVGVITDRDLALAVVADRVDPADLAGSVASRPIVTGEVEMDLEEYVARVIAGEGQPRAGAAAQQALAITVRTFAVANRGRHRREGGVT